MPTHTTPVDLILSASWVLPIAPENTVLNSHALVINQANIIDVLPIPEASLKYQASQHQHFDNHVLMPGLVNTHTHAAMSLLRGYADDLPLMEWLEQHIWPAEAQYVNADFVYQGTQLAIAEMLRSGTTCFSDMYFFPGQAARAATQAGMRAQLSFPIFDMPSAYGSGANDYINKGLALRDEYLSNPLLGFSFGPHAPYTVNDEQLERIGVLAQELNCGIQIHLHETLFEIEQSLQHYKERPVQRLQRLGLISPSLQAVHCAHLDDSDIQCLTTAGAHLIHCPESNLKLASGIMPVAQCINAKLNIALGTDGAASNNDLDLFSEMRTAALLAKIASSDSTALTAHQALEMATINGAKALGLDDKIGSLEIGKAADIIALNLNRAEAQPIHQLHSLLCYSNCAHWVEHVWVAGKQLLKDRELCTLDESEIIANSNTWQQRLSR